MFFLFSTNFRDNINFTCKKIALFFQLTIIVFFVLLLMKDKRLKHLIKKNYTTPNLYENPENSYLR